MTPSSKIPGPECTTCDQPMLWTSVQLVGTQPVNVFHCEKCDKFAAAAVTAASTSGGGNLKNKTQA